MQNVFPARELYNSNPCRDMWDNEQLSQATTSCSQGSQNSSSDLFSQSRMSQLKGFNSTDVWSQPSSSQQLPEEEPGKYYMKYMTKPPLFSSESERQTQRKQNPQTTSYKELIEIQKKRTAERDDRDVLDSFISLLKDYTKEVKSAMDSFKEGIDTTLATKAEEVALAASQSADLIKKLKDDLLEGFGCLRKDLKENEELKGIISKQNEKIIEQESKVKTLQSQLDDSRAREVRSMEKHEKYIERDDKLMQKLEEINNKQAPLPSNLPSSFGHFTYNQVSGYLENSSEVHLSQKPSVIAYQPQLPWERAEIPRYGKLHHMLPKAHSESHPFVQNIATVGVRNMNEQGSTYEESIPALHYHSRPQVQNTATADVRNIDEQGSTYGEPLTALNHHSRPQGALDEAVVPCCVNAPQYQANMALASNQNVAHPTAAIAPMRPFSNESQPFCEKEKNIIECGNQNVSRAQQDVEFVPDYDTHPRETNRGFTSPVSRVPSLAKVTRPKQSPIAAVHPQVRVKSECEEENTKVARPSCTKKIRKEDPFDIFVFDLTSSPEEKDRDALMSQPKSLNATSKCYTVSNPDITRSKTKAGVNNSDKQVSANSTSEADDAEGHLRSKSKSTGGVPETSVEEDFSSLQGKVMVQASKGKGSNCCSVGSNTPKRPVKASLDNGIPRSKVAQSLFQKSKIFFKRNLGAAKRKLSFDASELFDGLEDDTNIQQITESIRKHAQRKRAAKVV